MKTDFQKGTFKRKPLLINPNLSVAPLSEAQESLGTLIAGQPGSLALKIPELRLDSLKRLSGFSHATLYNGDCIDRMDSFKENSIDAIITDPPYFLDKLDKN